MLGSKTDAPNLKSPITKTISPFEKLLVPTVQVVCQGMRLLKKVFKLVVAMSAFFMLSSCVMTKTQGDRLAMQVRYVEDEIAKLQRVRHDMEVLLLGQVRDIVDRIARVESQLVTLRESLSEGSYRSTEVVAELQMLRDEIDRAKNIYRNLEVGQQDLAKSQNALLEAQSKIRIPPFKDDHFALAKKYYLSGKFDESIYLLDEFITAHPQEKELVAQSYYILGEINKKLADGEKTVENADKLYKKSVVYYQKIIESHRDSVLREEALYKIGLSLRALKNQKGAEAAFKELLDKHKNGKRAAEAKKQLAELEEPKTVHLNETVKGKNTAKKKEH